MAPYRKQRKLELPAESASDSDEHESNHASDEEMEMIEVDFDVKVPDQVDFHGIKNLLHQLFLKAHINTSELADQLIKQNQITGIIKQAYDEDDEMEVEDPDDLDVNFGVFSVINLTELKSMECVNQIFTYLLSHSKKACSEESFQTFKKILEDPDKHVGLIISERMVNIPPRIALPLYSGLGDDMAQAKAKGEPFTFEYFILICKIVVFEEGTSKENVIYTNGEEEIISEVASMSFDFSVSSEIDSGLAGEWTDDDSEGQRKRRVLVVPFSNWDTMCNKLSAELAAT